MKTMLYKVLVLAFCLFPMQGFSQDGIIGTYFYKFTEGTYYYSETISLYPAGNFFYKLVSTMGLKSEVHGNWQKKGNNLILDSYPQRDRIIVREYFKKKCKGITLNVVDKKGNIFLYHLFAIFQNGDTISLKNQIGQTNIQKKIKSFWIEDTKGLKSPQYVMISEETNYMDVIFETKRVFENENWLIKTENKLIPRGWNGNLQDYCLIKEKSNL